MEDSIKDNLCREGEDREGGMEESSSDCKNRGKGSLKEGQRSDNLRIMFLFDSFSPLLLLSLSMLSFFCCQGAVLDSLMDGFRTENQFV